MVELDAQKLAKSITLNIKMVGYSRFRLRTFILIQLIKFAGFIGGYNIEVVNRES